MFQWLVDLIWSAFTKGGEFILSWLLWLLEFIYDLVSTFIDFLADIALSVFTLLLDAVAEALPSGWVTEITAIYPTLQYIDSWVPVSYGLKLFLGYYAIKSALIPIRWLLKLIPGLGG